MLANETFYSALIIAVFIFSDATPELSIKFGAAVVLIVSVNGMIFANFIMVIACVWKGRDRLKDEIKQAKLRRAERELMEEEEEEERRQRQQKEEEEFTKLPEDTTDMAAIEGKEDIDELNTDAGTDSKKKKKKKRDKKKANNNDELSEFNMAGTDGSTIGNTTSGLMDDTGDALKGEKKKKKKKRRDKKKAG